MYAKMNIHYALTPVNYFFSFCGIQSYSNKKNKVSTKTRFSKAYPVFLACGIFVSFAFQIIIKMLIEVKLSMSAIAITDNLTYFFLVFTALCSLTCPVFGSSRLAMKYFDNIECVDKLLDLPPECYEAMRKMIRIYLLFVVYSVITVSLDFIAWYGPLSFYYITMYIAFFIVDFLIFQYALYVWIIIFRMRALVSQLIYSDSQLHKTDCIDFSPNNNMFVDCWNKMNKLVLKCNVPYDFNARLLKLMMIYDKLADNVEIINSSYGLQVNYLYIYFYLMNATYAIHNKV